ncbi:hypothetical protein N5853_08765 [Bartonella sp. HY329]|uniref:hypothetical protein n=1 Tax=unclassified Bartonella TaxID=2645622 RepID=UPI0021CA6020|nr:MULTISPECIES: hypothetical protein [unclassified Bartonella]UXM94204.1 hypothetical protein N5853_08765 [Bartonella sp. HY329]UXN08526.1 hypothetical protein N5852_08775 [Bartonella sp. HY328]
MQQDKSFFNIVILSAIISGFAGVFTLYMTKYSPLLAYIFSFLTILPAIIVSLIKGIRAGAITTIIAFILCCFTLPINLSISLFISLLLPALYISFMLSIVAVRRDTKEANWVPLSSILFNICIICVVVVVMLTGFFNIFSAQPLLSDATFNEIQSHFNAENFNSLTNLSLDPDKIDQIKLSIAQIKLIIDDNFVFYTIAGITLLIISSLFSMLLLAVYTACRFVANKNLSPRPRNFWPTDLVMPPMGITVLLVALIASGFPAMNYTLLLCTISLSIAFSLGFFASGLAFIHHITIGKSWRVIALVLAYILIFIFAFSGISTMIVIALGVLSTVLRAIKDKKQQIDTPLN